MSVPRKDRESSEFIQAHGRWRMPATPPAGDNWVLALVSDTPDRFRDLGKNEGIFKNMGNNGSSARGLFDFLFKPANSAAPSGADHDAKEPNPLSKGYGAALLKVTEVD